MKTVEDWSGDVLEWMAQEFAKSTDAESIEEVLRRYRNLLIRDAQAQVENALIVEEIRRRLMVVAH